MKIGNFETGNSGNMIAFTLAEVLITLGVIGVVAAVTMPVLIQNSREKATVAQLREFYSVFSNAYSLAIYDHGTFDTWELGDTVRFEDEDGNQVPTEESLDAYDRFFQIMEPYLKKGDYIKLTAKNTTSGAVDTLYSRRGYVLANGIMISALYFNTTSAACASGGYCGDFYVVTNGQSVYKAGTNKYSNYLFKFKFKKDKIIPNGLTDSEFASCLNRKDNSLCTAWVLYNQNMDYLHCSDLSWKGKLKCKN